MVICNAHVAITPKESYVYARRVAMI
jgi:hypothetical protein